MKEQPTSLVSLSFVDHSRVAPASHPAEALARTGLGHFDHPAPPL